MKKEIIYILIFAALLPIAGCKEDVPTVFAEPDGIYFSAPADSMTYTFAKYPTRLSDTLKIPVTVLGKPTDKDRTISLEKLSGADINGTEGVHYKLLQPYTLPAGKVSTMLPVVIYKTGDMDSLSFNFKFQLKANENFVSGISAKTSLKIKVGYLQKPPTWGDLTGLQWAGYSLNMGTWTKTKYKVVLDALYDPVSDTTVSEFPYPRFGPPAIYIQYLQLVKNYIRTNYPGNYSFPRGIGATLRDPDNKDSVIQVGPSNY
ncbi:MAG TPA: DUF4843 domain-containing protein [Chitinophagaceae bacterium]